MAHYIPRYDLTRPSWPCQLIWPLSNSNVQQGLLMPNSSILQLHERIIQVHEGDQTFEKVFISGCFTIESIIVVENPDRPHWIECGYLALGCEPLSTSGDTCSP